MEFLLTMKPNNKAGIKMQVAVYEAMKKEIVDLIESANGVPLQSFFEILHPRFVDLLGEQTGWYLYHVKLDLETRTVIKVERSKGKRNIKTVIKMAPRNRRYKSRLALV